MKITIEKTKLKEKEEKITKFEKKDLEKLDIKTLNKYAEEIGVSISKQDHLKCKKEGEQGLRLLFYYMLNFDKTKKEQVIEFKHLPGKPIVTLVNEDFKEEQHIEEDIDDFLIYNNKGEFKAVNIDAVTNFFLEKYNFKTLYGEKTDTIYFYDNGIWNKTGRQIIKTDTESLLKNYCKSNVVFEVLEKIKRKTAIDSEIFHKIPEWYLCIENGVINLKTGEILEHSSKYYFKTKFNITYDKDADCPNIKKFLKDAFYEEDILFIEEWFGNNLLNLHIEKKALILFGEKNTGKTIFQNVLSKFIGIKNLTGLSLHKICIGKPFDILSLKDKYSNIYDDLSAKDLTDVGGFKIATGGGRVTGEEKFGSIHSFWTFAKHTFTANTIPPVKLPDDDAYWSRWLPIRLDNQVPIKEQDKKLIEKLTTQEELSGLLNLALKGLNRLLKNNGFSFYKSVEEVKQIMLRSSHPLTAFSEDCLMKLDGSKVSKQDMFIVYSAWCEEYKKARMSKEQLGRQLQRFCPYIIPKSVSKERVWENCKFSENVKSFSKNNTYNTLLKNMRWIEKDIKLNKIIIEKI